jgi:hypothetical protein
MNPKHKRASLTVADCGDSTLGIDTGENWRVHRGVVRPLSQQLRAAQEKAGDKSGAPDYSDA